MDCNTSGLVPLARQDDQLEQPQLNHQSISHLSATNNSNIFAGKVGDVYIGDSKDLNDVLKSLPSAKDAPFNAYDRQDEPACLPNTRIDLLQEIYDWADGQDGQDERCIFWLSGLAGTGKSTISRTVARMFNEQKRLGASFFFSRGGGDVSHAGKFFTSLAVQLADAVPSLRAHICDVVRERSDIANLSLLDQWRELFIRPLELVKSDPSSPSSYLIVVDALDECENEGHVRTILQLLAEARSLTAVRLRVFLTSRPEVPIRHAIRAISQAEYHYFALHDIEPAIINHDISLFFKYHLGRIGQEWHLGPTWPGEEALRLLVISSSGLFIWASTICRFVRVGRRFARQRLDTILKAGNIAVTAPEKQLNDIYLTVLRHSISSQYSDEEKEEACDMLKHILGSTVVLLSPLSTSALRRLLQVSKEDIESTFNDLHAIIDISHDPTRQLRLHHPSFRDFLHGKDRCGEFWVDEKEAHRRLTTSCLQLMSQSLKRDVCDMHAPGTPSSQVDSSRLQKCVPLEVQYACLYWVQHLLQSRSQASDNDEVHQFLQTHLLHWLEALGWIGKASEGIQAILSLEVHVSENESPNLHAFIYDAKKFALFSRLMIEQVPLQLYCSALAFAPEKSIIRRTFEKYIPSWIQIKPKIQALWSIVLMALEGHSDSVRSVAFAPDGKQVVSGSDDTTIRLWDVTTGAALQILEGHCSPVWSVAFSPDGKQVISGSHDKTVRLWDAATGVALQTLEGHTSYVYSVAFFPDGSQVVSGSNDHTVRLWNATTGAALQTLDGHTSGVNSIAVSRDNKQIVSGSDDTTIRLWDAMTGAVMQTLKGHSDIVWSVAFSPDGKQVVSGSYDKTVRLWDALTGATIQTLEGHTDWIAAVAFSPDGKQVVSGSHDNTIRVWDAIIGTEIQTLEDYSDCIWSVAFSPDGKQVVCGSFEKTVRLWDTMTDAALQMRGGQSGSVTLVAASSDGKHAVTGAALQTLEGHSDSVQSVTFSPDGKTFVSGSDDTTIRLWDAASGKVLQTFEGHTSSVDFVAFSPDGKQVVSGSKDTTIRLWDVATGVVLYILKGHIESISCIAFSPNGKQIISGSADTTLRLWDAVIGVMVQTLKGHTQWISSVIFSPNGKQIISGSLDKTVRLWDVTTGSTLQTLKGHTDWVKSVAVSPNGKQVVSGSLSGIILLWDVATGMALLRLEGHIDMVTSVAFSPNGKQVVSGSGDQTIRFWDARTGTILQTVEGHSSFVKSVAFSLDGILLPTLRVSDNWVTEGEANILWLPFEYRSRVEAVYDQTIVLAHSIGRLSVLHFKQGPKLIE